MTSGDTTERTPTAADRPRLLGAGCNLPDHGRLIGIPALMLLIGTPINIIFHYVAGAYLRLGYPWTTFLVHPKSRFSDYYLSYRDALNYHPGESTNMVYSPVMHLLMTVLTSVPATVGFAAIVAAFGATVIAVSWGWLSASDSGTALRLQQAVIFVLLSYPVLFVIDRGNLEMLVFVALAAFFWLYYRRGSNWAWLPLAFAIAAKYYWVTLLILLISDRQLRQAVWALLAAAGLTLASVLVLMLTSGFGFLQVIANTLSTLGNREASFSSFLAFQHSHTIWSLIQFSDRFTDYFTEGVYHFKLGYLLVAAMVFVLIAYNVLTRRLAPWRKVLLLVAATLVLPFESFDYTLLHLYFPLALLVCTAPVTRVARATTVLLALMLMPVDYYYLNMNSFTYWTSPSLPIYVLALLALIVVTLVTGERERVPIKSLFVWRRRPRAGTPVGVEEAA